MKNNKIDTFFDFIEITVIATVVYILVFMFVGQEMGISGNSMYPTLKDQERLIAEKISVKVKPLSRGEVVIFWHPKNPTIPLIKRLIVLPNEEVKIKAGKVYINDQILDEPYLSSSFTIPGNFLKEGEVYKTKSNEYMFFGDNRDESTDSREWGPVNQSNLIGKGVLVYYPLTNFRTVKALH